MRYSFYLYLYIKLNEYIVPNITISLNNFFTFMFRDRKISQDA